MEQDTVVDVVIVGAGLSGLAAADFLQQENATRAVAGKPPLSLRVLEGSARAGGRTLTDPQATGFLDLGGAYIAPTQSYTNTLIERFQLATFHTWLPDGKLSQYEREDGTLIPFPDPNYPLAVPGQAGTDTVAENIGAIEAAILPIRAHLERPWEAYRAPELDAITVQQYMDEKMGKPTDTLSRELLTLAVRSAFSVEPSELSLFYFLYYGATCGSMRAFENVKGGGDSIRLVHGTQKLIAGLTAAVGEGNIRYQSYVNAISQTATSVTVTLQTAAGATERIAAKRVIVAMSPGATQRIERFTPPLSEARKALVAGTPMAATIKGFLTFKQAWWRRQFTGYALSAAGPADWVLDNTWWDPADELWKYPALMTFIVGKKARELSENATYEERKAALLAQVYRLFDGNERDFPCTGYYEKDWLRDPWSHGCPAGCLAPGVLTRYGTALRTPEGRIHWAGSESATDWMGGYMNGAIQSGIRAAAEVLRLEYA